MTLTTTATPSSAPGTRPCSSSASWSW